MQIPTHALNKHLFIKQALRAGHEDAEDAAMDTPESGQLCGHGGDAAMERRGAKSAHEAAYSFKPAAQGSPRVHSCLSQDLQLEREEPIVISGQRVPGRGDSKGKGSGAVGWLVCSRIGEHAGVDGGGRSGGEDGAATPVLGTPARSLCFTLGNLEPQEGVKRRRNPAWLPSGREKWQDGRHGLKDTAVIQASMW